VDTVAGVTLDKYQVDGVKFALEHDGAVLGYRVGLGKTLTALSAALTWAAVDKTRCWIVAPLNAHPTWKRYLSVLQTAFNEMRLVSVDSLHKFASAAPDGGVIIFDEAHQLGGANTRRTKAAHQVRLGFRFGICLTGTLLHAGPEKVLSVLDLAVPGSSLFQDPIEFGRYFDCYRMIEIPNGHGGTRSVAKVDPVPKHRIDEFATFLSRVTMLLSANSQDVRDVFMLPEQITETVCLGQPWPTLDVDVVRVASQALAEGKELPSAMEVVHVIAREGVAAKLAWLQEQIGDDRETQMVFFAGYLDTLDALQAWCEVQGIRFARIDGDVGTTERAQIEQDFQAGAVQVLLAQMKAGSVSLNLQCANISVAVDHNRSAIDYEQMLGRTCRRGSDATCYHWDLTSNSLQYTIVDTLRSGRAFDSSVTAWQEAARTLSERSFK
jgi:SNF2 family DNA or RNA helicase